MPVVLCYYWIYQYVSNDGNPQRDEFITGFLMAMWLTSPVSIGFVISTIWRRKQLSNVQKALYIFPAILLVMGYIGLLMNLPSI